VGGNAAELPAGTPAPVSLGRPTSAWLGPPPVYLAGPDLVVAPTPKDFRSSPLLTISRAGRIDDLAPAGFEGCDPTGTDGTEIAIDCVRVENGSGVGYVVLWTPGRGIRIVLLSNAAEPTIGGGWLVWSTDDPRTGSQVLEGVPATGLAPPG
jgi:hypothetical protein